MTTSSTVQALADVAHALVENADLHDVLVHVLDDCRRVLAADAVGLMVQPHGGELELLAATSHRTSELELFQIQTSEGPCPEVIRTGAPVVVSGATELRERWPRVGRTVIEAGYEDRAFEFLVRSSQDTKSRSGTWPPSWSSRPASSTGRTAPCRTELLLSLRIRPESGTSWPVGRVLSSPHGEGRPSI